MTSAGKKNLWPWLLIAIQLGLLIFFAFNRLVDGDEGFYLSAAREVAQGRMLYSDFFYPQMPYLPYVFSIFAGHGFTTLFTTRLASVLMGLLTTLIFYKLIKTLTTDRTTINIVLALYVFSGLVISWHSVAKTFAWTDLFLLGSFASLMIFLRSQKIWPVALCGVLIALAVNARLVLMPLIIVFYLPLVIHSGRAWLKRTLAYFLPMLAATVPSFLLLFRDPGRFMFDNLGFHFMRNPGVEFPASFYQKLWTIGKVLINPQILILLAAAAGTYFFWRRHRQATDKKNIFTSPYGIAGVAAAVIAVTYLLPNPVLQQYFVQAVPFVLLASVGGIEAFVARQHRSGLSGFRQKLPLYLTAVYILGVIPYFVVYIGAVREFDGYSNLGNMKRVCASLNQTDDTDPILTEMPIISVLANKPTFEGIEFLGFEYPLPLNAEKMRHYRFILNEDLKEILDNREASYFVVVNKTPEALVAATEGNYELQGRFERYLVYRRKS